MILVCGLWWGEVAGVVSCCHIHSWVLHWHWSTHTHQYLPFNLILWDGVSVCAGMYSIHWSNADMIWLVSCPAVHTPPTFYSVENVWWLDLSLTPFSGMANEHTLKYCRLGHWFRTIEGSKAVQFNQLVTSSLVYDFHPQESFSLFQIRKKYCNTIYNNTGLKVGLNNK